MVKDTRQKNEFSKFFNSADYIALKNMIFNYKFRKHMLNKEYAKHFTRANNVKILDIGCGISPVSPNKSNTLFIESDKNAVELLKKTGHKAIVGDITKIPLKNDFADAVFCSEVLEHVRDYKKALKEMFRVLKKEGLLFITVPTHMKYWAFDDDYVGHLRRFNPRLLLNELKEQDFEIVESIPIGSIIERELTKILVKNAINQKYTKKLSENKIKFFRFVNNILFYVVYFSYLLNNEENSSIIMFVCKKK